MLGDALEAIFLKYWTLSAINYTFHSLSLPSIYYKVINHSLYWPLQMGNISSIFMQLSKQSIVLAILSAHFHQKLHNPNFLLQQC